MNDKCKWTMIDNAFGHSLYETFCDRLFEFNQSSLKDNDFKYCPYCGKEIEVIES